jgi:Peptidase family S41
VTKPSLVLGSLVLFVAMRAEARWTPSIGAGGGDRASTVSVTGERVVLEGDARTTAWQVVAEPQAVLPGSWWELRFTANAAFVGEPGRFGDCYVGLGFYDAKGGRAGGKVAQLDGRGRERFFAQVPANAVRADVMIFLSRPGRLEVADVALAPVAVPDSWTILVDDMDRFYSHFEKRGRFDWRAHTAKLEARGRAAKDPAAFAEVVVELLAPLEDLHVSVTPPGAPTRYPFVPKVAANLDAKATFARLSGLERINRQAAVATVDGFGYLALGGLTFGPAELDALDAAMARLVERPGIIFDLRPNGGGDETQAQRLVAWVTDRERVYARSAFRAGKGFGPARGRAVKPRGAYAKPVAVLVGPACASSCEGMAMALAVLPHARLFGAPTGGASANPQPLTLPNGVVVTYSRWKTMFPDGTPLEGRGVLPAEAVAHVAGRDLVLEAALRWMAKGPPR